MTLKPTLMAAVLALAVAACSTDAPVATTAAVTPTTGAGQTTSTTAAEQASTTAVPTTTEAPTTTTTVPEVLEFEISYVSGTVEGGGRLEVPLGEPVVIRIDSDVADEGHLHGYDIFVDLVPGTTGVIEFIADIPGIFELELEGTRVLLADLEVAP